MAAIVPVGEIRKFFNENRSDLVEEYRLVAEEPDAGVEVYITDEHGVPYFVVEVDGADEYEAKASSETEIEGVYSQLLNLYVCETEESEAVTRRTRNQMYRRKLAIQKLYGLALIAMSVIMLYIASQGVTIEDRDATAVLLTAPLGLYLLFTRKIAIY